MIRPAFILLRIFVIAQTSKLVAYAQDYEIKDINCASSQEFIGAQIYRPLGFSGDPILADVSKFMDPSLCKIVPAGNGSYSLFVHDYEECGVREESGFVSIRVWFPKVEGVVTLSDQEVIILCKPPLSVVSQSKAASYSSHLPPAARVSGIVEEIPGNLKYEVALYKNARGLDEPPIDEEVPIGTHLQLRASINTDSAWKYIKLMDVSISPQSINPEAKGSVHLVRNGCPLKEFRSIVPKTPFHPLTVNNTTNFGEVRLEFEAVILQTTKPVNRLWIHARIKGCVHREDCLQGLCSGLVRRKRKSSDEETNFDENVGFTVVMSKGKGKQHTQSMSYKSISCTSYLIISVLIGFFLVLLSALLVILSFRLYKLSQHSMKYSEPINFYRNPSGSCSTSS